MKTISSLALFAVISAVGCATAVQTGEEGASADDGATRMLPDPTEATGGGGPAASSGGGSSTSSGGGSGLVGGETGGTTGDGDGDDPLPGDGDGDTSAGCGNGECRAWTDYSYNDSNNMEDLPAVGHCVTGTDGKNYELTSLNDKWPTACGPAPDERADWCDDPNGTPPSVFTACN